MTDNIFDILFENATILTMVDAQPVLQGSVGIKGSRILYVGPDKPEHQARRRIPCGGKVLMPGLVNAHTHTAMTLLRGYADDYPLQAWLHEKVFPAEARLDERAVLAGALLGFAEQLCTGTTSISDMYYFQPAVAKLALDVGIRATFCNGVITFDEGWAPENDRGIQETLALAKDFHGAGDGRILADASIHGEYTSYPRVWRTVAELAQKHGLGMQVHLSETRSEHLESFQRNGGKSPAQALAEAGAFDVRATAAHCVWVSEDDMALMAAKGVSAVHCPISNLKLGSGVANLAALRHMGVNVALGTDGCCSNNNHDLFEEMKLAALLAKGLTLDPASLPAYEALKMATVNGARAQGRNNIGQVAENMEADLILLDLDHPTTRPNHDAMGAVVYSATGRSVCLTMVQGRILYENGAFTTIDLEKAYAEAEGYGLARLKGAQA